MANKSPILLPRLKKILVEVGENIKLARLRRKLSAEQVADRTNCLDKYCKAKIPSIILYS